LRSAMAATPQGSVARSRPSTASLTRVIVYLGGDVPGRLQGLAAGRGRSGSGRLARSAHADKAVVGRLRERRDQAQIGTGARAFGLNIVPMACTFAVRVAQPMVRNDRWARLKAARICLIVRKFLSRSP
jgi:hypothetical protein